MNCYLRNTVYTDIHQDAVLPYPVDIYVTNWEDQSGVYNDGGLLKIAAMIFWPPHRGYIWHHVTDVALTDYHIYQEVLKEVFEP